MAVYLLPLLLRRKLWFCLYKILLLLLCVATPASTLIALTSLLQLLSNIVLVDRRDACMGDCWNFGTNSVSPRAVTCFQYNTEKQEA